MSMSFLSSRSVWTCASTVRPALSAPRHGATAGCSHRLCCAVIDFGRQHVITKDTVQIMIDALVYFRVTDPRVAVLNIQVSHPACGGFPQHRAMARC